MADLQDGESIEVRGSAKLPYVLKNVGGVYSCTCPAWRNQSVGIERRTCKHLRKLRGEAAETERLGSASPARPAEPAEGDDAAGPGLLLAQNWTNDVDLAGWWLSEKLDGVRAYWDGKQFVSRQGNLFHAPDWFVEQLPKVPLDGELWLARKSFQRTVSIVRRQDKSDLWRELKFVVFDAPAINDPFERRLAALGELFVAEPSEFATVLEQQPCRDEEHLRAELARIEALGGEGLMLRQPGSLYEAGRSTTLLKVKRFHDAEATVLEHLPGAGRHKGRLGALAVQLPDGTHFSVGTGFSDAQRENPPAVGSLITFRYQELTDAGVPRFPSFVRLRTEGAIAAEKKPTTKRQAAQVVSEQLAVDAGPTSKEQAAMRHFEFVGGNSAKFWEIEISGTDVNVRYGRLGTTGQTSEKSFPDQAAAQKHADKLIQEKLDKGYVESSVK
jgi:DNA ligase 1